MGHHGGVNRPLLAVARQLSQAPAAASHTLSPYGRQVLTEPFAAWATRILSNTTPDP